MQFRVIFKTPDALDHLKDDLSEDELEQAIEFAQKFVTCGELIKVDFDTEAGTATLVKR